MDIGLSGLVSRCTCLFNGNILLETLLETEGANAGPAAARFLAIAGRSMSHVTLNVTFHLDSGPRLPLVLHSWNT